MWERFSAFQSSAFHGDLDAALAGDGHRLERAVRVSGEIVGIVVAPLTTPLSHNTRTTTFLVRRLATRVQRPSGIQMSTSMKSTAVDRGHQIAGEDVHIPATLAWLSDSVRRRYFPAPVRFRTRSRDRRFRPRCRGPRREIDRRHPVRRPRLDDAPGTERPAQQVGQRRFGRIERHHLVGENRLPSAVWVVSQLPPCVMRCF